MLWATEHGPFLSCRKDTFPCPHTEVPESPGTMLHLWVPRPDTLGPYPGPATDYNCDLVQVTLLCLRLLICDGWVTLVPVQW